MIKLKDNIDNNRSRSDQYDFTDFRQFQSFMSVHALWMVLITDRIGKVELVE